MASTLFRTTLSRLGVRVPIRVAHITLNMHTGGIENFILNFSRKIDRTKFELTVGCLDGGGVLLDDIDRLGHKSFVLSRRPGLDLSLIFELAKTFRKAGYHIIHTHNQASHFYAGLAARLAGVPCLITTEHSRHNIDLKLRRRIEKFFLSRITDAWITVSADLAHAAVQKDGLSRAKVSVIPNGIDTDLFSVTESPEHKKRQNELRGSLEIQQDARVAIIVARLDPVKNHSMLLRALSSSELLKRRVCLLIVGDGELRDELTNLSRNLGLERCVRFLGLRRDIPDLLALSDLFVLCSHTEGLPLSLLEAMAAKVPVLITRPANKARLIMDGRNGRVVDHSSEALGQGILELLEAQSKFASFTGKAAELISESYAIDSMMHRYEKLYLDLCDGIAKPSKEMRLNSGDCHLA